MWRLSLLFLTLALFVGGPSAQGAEPELSGTALIVGNGPERYAVNDLAKEFEARYPHTSIDFFWHPNSKPVKSVRSGTADIAVTGIIEKDLPSTIIAWDGIAVVVNFANPLKGLTTDQLRQIFSGKVKFWSEVWEDAPETKIILLNRANNQNIRQSFEDQLGIQGNTRARTKFIGKEVHTFKAVNGKLGAISYVSMGPALQAKSDGYGVNLLFVNGIEPERQTVLDATYPLRRPIVFVMQKDPSPVAEALVKFVLSPKGQRLIKAGRYYPLED